MHSMSLMWSFIVVAKTTTAVPHMVKCFEYKWKNHFHEMKGDVGMSHNEGNKKMPSQKVTSLLWKLLLCYE